VDFFEPCNHRIGSVWVAGLTPERIGECDARTREHVSGGVYAGGERTQTVAAFEYGHDAPITELIGGTTEKLKEMAIPGYRQATIPDGIIPVCIKTSRYEDAFWTEAQERRNNDLLVDTEHGRVPGVGRYRNVERAPMPGVNAHFVHLTAERVER
jgi:hypothetical protein